jgi:prolyl 4-hydroxylase
MACHFHLPFWLVLCLVWLFPVIIASAQSSEMTCEADGSCNTNSATSNEEQPQVPADQQFRVVVTNKSIYRADVYFDDGRFGTKVFTVEAKGGTATLNTYSGHEFVVTRHGVREGLFDLETDTPYRFQASNPEEPFVIPKDAAPSPNPCHDRYSVCPSEADGGGCWNNPGWMIVNCCKSCDSHTNASRLIDPKVRCSKEHLNLTSPAWKPGDLHQLFSSWATDEKFAEYEPTVLSSPEGAHGGDSGPWVMIFDNFISSTEADALIRGGELVGFERSTDQGAVNALGEQERAVSTTRTSANAWCRGACEALPEVNAVTERIETVTHIPRTNYENFQILEYEHDQFYRMHHDSNLKNREKPAGPRILTFFLYLSDVEEGGETYFNKLDLAVKPKKGRALVWPSVQNEQPDYWDDRMHHEAKPVIRGKKYAANHWIHLNDFIGPNNWGCTGSFS